MVLFDCLLVYLWLVLCVEISCHDWCNKGRINPVVYSLQIGYCYISSCDRSFCYFNTQGDNSEGECSQSAWDKWSNHDIEQEVAKLMEDDVGAAMQYLQSKALCIMPISLASAIYPTHSPDGSMLVKPEPNGPS